MQVLPTFLSTDPDGNDEREFLNEAFPDPSQLLSLIFLKGYQWPFDVSKIFGGSSMLDLLVYQETVLKGRRVFLDFMRNPCGKAIDFDRLSPETHDYLSKAGACFGTPIERLAYMNQPAIDFYRDKGVDLAKEPLEIALCAQHNNGGLSTDEWWQTEVRGLFAVGELCGSHGVTRPGGTALNAGQVGALRAAEAICRQKRHASSENFTDEAVRKALRAQAEAFVAMAEAAAGSIPLEEIQVEATRRMSACGGMIRDPASLESALQETRNTVERYSLLVERPTVSQLPLFYQLRDTLIAQTVYLSAMLDYCRCGGGSRGSALYTDADGSLPADNFPELFRFRLDHAAHSEVVQEVRLKSTAPLTIETNWRAVRPIPKVDYFFETQWRGYRQRCGIS